MPFSFSNFSQLFSLYGLKQPTKQCVVAVCSESVPFLRKINLTGKKIKSRHIICLKITVPIFYLSAKHLIYLFAKHSFCEEIVIF